MRSKKNAGAVMGAGASELLRVVRPMGRRAAYTWTDRA